MLDGVSYRMNQADQLPQAQLACAGQKIFVKAKTTTLGGNTILKDKQNIVELKNRKLFDWKPMNFKLASTMGVMNSRKEEAV